MEYHGIFIPFKVQIYSKQGNHISLLFGIWTYFNIISLCLDEAKVSIVNTDLINYAGVQRLHKNIKWIMFLLGFSYTLLTRTLLLFRTSSLKRLFIEELIYLIDSPWCNNSWPTACLQEKSSQKKNFLTWLIYIFQMLVEETISPIAYATDWTFVGL